MIRFPWALLFLFSSTNFFAFNPNEINSVSGLDNISRIVSAYPSTV